MRRDPSKGLGRTQTLVLHLLADNNKTCATLASDGFGLTDGQAWSAVDRLAHRGLVDATGFDQRDRREYGLTSLGREVERRIVDDYAGDGDES